MPIKILYVGANPEGTDNVRLDEELRDIKKELESSKYRDEIEFHTLTATRVRDLALALTELLPDVVHFSGHGNSSGEYVLLDKYDVAKPVEPERMASLFKAIEGNVKVVVFNCCFSQSQAEAVNDMVPCCIGTSDEVDDLPSNLFASEFYRLLAAGRSVQNAFNVARETLKLSDYEDEAGKYQLFTASGVDAGTLTLVSKTEVAAPPQMQAEVTWQKCGTETNTGQTTGYLVQLCINNVGTIAATDFCVDVYESDSFNPTANNVYKESEHYSRPQHGFVMQGGRRTFRFTNRPGEVLYPGQRIPFLQLVLRDIADATQLISAEYSFSSTGGNGKGTVTFSIGEVASA